MVPGTISKIRETLAGEGLYPEELIIDGKIHRFSTNGKRSDKAGFYSFWDHGNGFVAGFFGDWRSGLRKTWHSKQGQRLSESEAQKVKEQVSKAREKLRRERQRRARQAAENAIRMLAEAKPAAADNPYLKSKKVKPCPGLKQLGRTLLVPIQDIKGNVHGLQKIKPDGTKLFLPGMAVRSHFFRINGKDSRLYVCEGIATGLSIYEATGCQVFCAFNCGNLKPVAQAIREKYPSTEIIICSDNDAWTEGNPGLTKATEAAQAINAKLAIPEFQNTITKPTDFNDLHVLEGVNMAKEQLQNAEIVELPLGNIDDEKEERKTQSEILLEICMIVEFFHDPKGVPYARIPVKGHKEVWPVRSQGFKRWLSRKFYVQEGKAPNSQALADTLNVLEGRAQFDGKEHEVFVRVGHSEGKIYLDLCNENWEVVEITKEGWQIIQAPPIYFRRTKAMASLPIPAHKGDITLLRDLLNVESEQDWILLVSWLVGSLDPHIGYPVMALHGEQGSAKSTASRILRSIIDPSTIPLRTTPRNEHDLVIAANNAWALAFDNLSSIPSWLSDAFCRLSTGGGMSTRQLYSDDEEVLFSAKRPLIINGISEVVSRHDLADRTIFINFPPIPDERRLRESELNARFREAHDKILAGLLDAVSTALRNKDSVRLASLPRMADFASWVVAGEEALPWETGNFLKAYTQNRKEIIRKSVEADPVANALLQWFEGQDSWEGTPTELLTILEGTVDEKTTKLKGWPKNSSWFSRNLTRSASFLRKLGIDIARVRGDSRTIKIERVRKMASMASMASESSNSSKLDPDGKPTATDGKQNGVGMASGCKCRTDAVSVTTDGIDGKNHTFSMEGKIEDAFNHYIPPSQTATTSQTNNHAGSGGNQNVTQGDGVAFQNRHKPAWNKECCGVAFQTGGNKEKKKFKPLFGEDEDMEEFIL